MGKLRRMKFPGIERISSAGRQVRAERRVGFSRRGREAEET